MNIGSRTMSWLDADFDFNASLDPADVARIFNQSTTGVPKSKPRKTLTAKDLAHAKKHAVSAARLIEKRFQEKIRVVQNGKNIRITIHEAIILTLYQGAMTGNHKALAALIRYSKFGANKADPKKRVIALHEMDDGVYMQEGAH